MDKPVLLQRFELIPRCEKCGSDDLVMPDGVVSQNDLSDDTPIACGACGATAAYAVIVAACEARAANDFINDGGTF